MFWFSDIFVSDYDLGTNLLDDGFVNVAQYGIRRHIKEAQKELVTEDGDRS